jgi:hypothetical protein
VPGKMLCSPSKNDETNDEINDEPMMTNDGLSENGVYPVYPQIRCFIVIFSFNIAIWGYT